MAGIKVVKVGVFGFLLTVLLLQIYTFLKPTPSPQLKLGYIDKSGRFVIEAKYDDARPFSGGLAAVKPDSATLAYIDKTGKTIIAPSDKYSFVRDASILPPKFFHEGLKSINRDGKMGFVNTDGDIVIKPRFNYVTFFSEGLVAVNIGDKWGYVDTNGLVVIEPRFNYAGNFAEGLAAVTVNGKAGFIDKNGDFAIQPHFDATYSFNEGFAAVRIADKYGFIDRTGRYVIEPQYDRFQGSFRHGLAMVAVGDKWRFIDKEGTLVIDAHLHGYELLYNLATDSIFSEGLSVVKLENGSFAFIDRSGLIAIDITFDSAKPFSEGLAAVEVDGNWGYIDRRGKFVIEPRFETAESFTEGLASVGLWVDI